MTSLGGEAVFNHESTATHTDAYAVSIGDVDRAALA
jgi:hypothetical protein